MCLSLRPARFSKTKGLAAEAMKGRKRVHLLGYGNNAINLFRAPGDDAPSPSYGRGGVRRGSSSYGRGSRPVAARRDEPSDAGTGNGNALFLPIPAKPGTMGPGNILDTSTCPNILKDIQRAIPRPMTRGGFGGGLRRGRGLSDSVQIFDHDIYTIVLAKNATDIGKVLAAVRADRRPALNKPVFDAYQTWYPGWTFALCCFNNKEEATAKPMLWWYEPSVPELLFFPGLDGHDGNPPALDGDVDVDHTVAFGSEKIAASGNGYEVEYTDRLTPDLAKLLPTHVIGEHYSGELQQGDWVADVQHVRNGRAGIRRELPPGA